MTILQFTTHILLSLFLGFIIGLERQLTKHPAGIRINVLICMGTCFFTLFPMLYQSQQVFRVGSSIISGVGFLCSGVIFKEDGFVRGMNTAATLWCTAAIGILATMNNIAWAIIATIVLVLSNLILRPLARKIGPYSLGEDTERQYRVSVVCFDDAEQDIRQLLIHSNTCKTLFLHNLESGDITGNQTEIVAEFCSSGKPKEHVLEALVSTTLKNPRVIRSGWEII